MSPTLLFVSNEVSLLWISAALLGIGLSASTGLRTFLPLLLLAGAAHFHLFGINLSGSYEWLGSETALFALGIATVAEVLGDKVPAIDHALDVFGTVSRPTAGAVATAAAFNAGHLSLDPATAAMLGLIIGAPLAFGVHAAKAGSRGVSTVSTFGLGNPILSVIEDFSVLILSLVALLAPLLVPVLLLIVGLLLWKLYHFARRFRRRLAA